MLFSVIGHRCACAVTIAPDQCVICADEQALMDDWCENYILVNYTEILVSTTPMAEEATGKEVIGLGRVAGGGA